MSSSSGTQNSRFGRDLTMWLQAVVLRLKSCKHTFILRTRLKLDWQLRFASLPRYPAPPRKLRVETPAITLYLHIDMGVSVNCKDCVSISGASNPTQSTLLSLRTHKGMRFPGVTYECCSCHPLTPCFESGCKPWLEWSHPTH